MSIAAPLSRPPAWHALHYLPENARTILDVGCNVGENLEHAHQLGIAGINGIEINPAAIAEARRRLAGIRALKLVQGSADQLPFEDRSMDVALCCEVLEHIPEDLRPAALREIERVLKPGAPFILTVPAAGLFAGLDPANMRFRLPAVYDALSRLLGGRGREAGFENQKHGVVWHHHFRLRELEALLLPAGFLIESLRWRGCLLGPLGNWLQFPFYRLGQHDHPMLKGINAVVNWELRLPLNERLAYNVIVVARKAAG